MRDRLIELLDQKVWDEWIPNEEIADHLLANGVIVPPCKVGTQVAVITSQTSNGKNLYIFEDRITQYRICESCVMMCFDNHLGVPNWDWDKVFAGENAREDAEKALKGGAE